MSKGGKRQGAGRPKGSKDSKKRKGSFLHLYTTEQLIENRKAIMRKYYNSHKEECKQRRKVYRKKYPWVNSYINARRRCLTKSDRAYKNYGGRGIKVLMTIADFKYLWFRDKAYLMKKPSIDRIDNDGHYELSNCQYLEVSENTKKAMKNRKANSIK